MDFIDYIKDQFINNELFIGLVFASILTMLWVSCKQIPRTCLDWCIRRYTTTITMYSDDPMYPYLYRWLTDQDFANRNKKFKVTSRRVENEETMKNDTVFSLSVAESSYIFRCEGKLIRVICGKDEAVQAKGDNGGGNTDSAMDDLSKMFKREMITIQHFGTDRKFIRSILDDITIRHELDHKDRIGVMTSGSSWGWSLLKEHIHKPVGSVVLQDDIANKIVEDLDMFLESKSWYSERGVPYQRGYLFYGPPGTGKTSMAIALASHLGKPIYCIDLGHGMCGSRFKSLLSETEPNSIVLMEDIDCAFDKRKTLIKDNLTFSQLLNSMDGIESKEGTIFIITTNHVDKLDEALLRPGRLDVKYEFGLADNYQIKRLFMKFYPDCEEHADRFTTRISENTYSPAVLQSLFIENRDPDGAIEAAGNIDDYDYTPEPPAPLPKDKQDESGAIEKTASA